MGDTSGKMRLRSRLTGACVLLLAVTACTQDGGDDEAGAEVPLESATRICDGTLSASAAEDLEALTEETEFRESRIPSVARADLEEFVGVLRASTSGYENFCYIYRPYDELDFATLAFGWRDSAPAEFEPEPDQMIFRTGEFAYTSGTTTNIFFSCPVGNAQGGVVSARLYDRSLRAGAPQVSILNSVSRAVADGLGCLEEAGLAEGRPERVG